MSWITENLCDFLTDFIGGTIDLFGGIINNIFLKIVNWNNENVYVQGATKFMVALGLASVALLVIKQVLTGYVLETDYDSDADPFNLIVRMVETIAVISCNAWIFSFLFSLSKQFATDIIGASGNIGVADQTQTLLEVEESQLGSLAFVYLVMIVVMFIAFVVFTVVAGLRGCELIAMKVFCPFFALDLLTTSRERWNNFFTGYMIAFATYGVQMLFFNISLRSFASVSYSRPEYMIGTLAWLFLAIRAPKFLEKYLYRTGVSGAASSGLRMVAQTAMLRR